MNDIDFARRIKFPIRMVVILSAFLSFMYSAMLPLLDVNGCVWNTGASYGWFVDSFFVLKFVVGILLVAIGVWTVRFWREAGVYVRIGMVLILLGGFVNFLQRIIWGGVCDHITLDLGWLVSNLGLASVSWRLLFNSADVVITAGVIMVLLAEYRRVRR